MTEDSGIQGFLPREIGRISGLKSLRFGTISGSMHIGAIKCRAPLSIHNSLLFDSSCSEQLDYWLHSYRIFESHGAENIGYSKLQLGRSPTYGIVGTA